MLQKILKHEGLLPLTKAYGQLPPWLGHTLSKSASRIARQAHWNSQKKKTEKRWT